MEPNRHEPETEAPASEAGEERQPVPFLVLQFFVFPMAIVAVSVAVFVIFGLIASEGKTARDYLSEIRTGGTNRRWQAAFELSKTIQAGRDPALADPAFVSEMTKLFEGARDDDPRVRRYLALALGRLADRRAVPALLECVREGGGAQADDQTLLYAIWALGAIADPVVVPDLAAVARSDDAGLRKTAVHALGGFDAPAARAALAEALDDAVPDVRWNAAVALARSGDAAGVPVLARMMDVQSMAGVEGLTPDQREEAVLQAIAAAARLKDPRLADALAKLRDSDPSLRVREAARRAAD